MRAASERDEDAQHASIINDAELGKAKKRRRRLRGTFGCCLPRAHARFSRRAFPRAQPPRFSAELRGNPSDAAGSHSDSWDRLATLRAQPGATSTRSSAAIIARHADACSPS